MTRSDTNEPTPTPAESESPSTDTDKTEWLDQVLRETLGGEGDGANPLLLQSLLEIRRGRLAEPFEIPVGEEMVSAALNVQYGASYPTQMSSTIAQSMCDDPVCRERLELLWNRLGSVIRGK